MRPQDRTPGVSLVVQTLYRRGTAVARALRRDLLHGDRVFGWPLAALRVQQDLGPVRHVLQQQVVAGTLVIHTPFERGPQTVSQQPAEPKDPSQ
jgi:hypothetical protein